MLHRAIATLLPCLLVLLLSACTAPRYELRPVGDSWGLAADDVTWVQRLGEEVLVEVDRHPPSEDLPLRAAISHEGATELEVSIRSTLEWFHEPLGETAAGELVRDGDTFVVEPDGLLELRLRLDRPSRLDVWDGDHLRIVDLHFQFAWGNDQHDREPWWHYAAYALIWTGFHAADAYLDNEFDDDSDDPNW